MRLICLLALLLASAAAKAADILILIPAADAGPIVPARDFKYPIWILWPSADGDGTNRLLSLASGMDWRTTPTDIPTLEKDGFFDAQKKYLGENPFVGMPDPKADPRTKLIVGKGDFLSARDAIPIKGILVATVTGEHAWDECAALIKQAGGRGLVLELPSSSDQMWTRAWLQGKGWPEGLPALKNVKVPGLLTAKKAAKFLQAPETANWVPWDLDKKSTANQWLEFGHETAPIVLVFLAVLALYVVGAAIYSIVREVRNRFVLFALRILMIGPAAIVVGGALTSLGTVANWPGWHLVAFAAVAGLAFLANLVAKRFGEFHPLWGECLVGLLIVALVPNAFSMLSPVLGPRAVGVSPEISGALMAYAVGICSLMDRKSSVTTFILFVALALCVFLYQWTNSVGKHEKPMFMGLAMALVIMDRRLFLTALVIAVVSAVGFDHVPRWTNANNDLYRSFLATNYINLYDYAAFASSPTFIGFAALLATSFLVGDRFLRHQFKRSLAFSPSPKAFGLCALGFALIGIFAPMSLYAAMITAMAGCVSVLFDAVRTP